MHIVEWKSIFNENSLFQEDLIDNESTTTSSSEGSSSSTTSSSTSSTTLLPSSSSTTPKEEEEEGNKWLLPLLIGIGVAVLIILVLTSLLIYKRFRCFGLLRRKRLQMTHPVLRRLSSKGSFASSLSSTISTISGGMGLGKNKSKSKKKYRKYLVRLGEDLSVRNVWGEFEALKRESPTDLPTSVALQSENIIKNRFSNVLPYDRNRYLLEIKVESEDKFSLETVGRRESDYVNASYLSGFGREKEFISTQGPRSNTIDDFWRMCWESKASSIVMLTKCFENDKEKCYPYWPSNILSPILNNLSSGISVRLENVSGYQYRGRRTGKEENKEGAENIRDTHYWLISELTMERGEESRKILHFYYLSWPDFGIVDPPAGLLCFLKHFRKMMSSSGMGQDEILKPTIVHCSAGVGRTGVFIAVDNLFRSLRGSEDNSSVNVFQIVQKMRTERMGMVQTPDQYKLIYDCLRELWKKDSEGKFVDIPEPTKVSPDLITISVEEYGASVSLDS